MIFLGATTQYCVRTVGAGALWASVHDSAHAFTGALGDRVGVRWEIDDVHVFPRSPGMPAGPRATAKPATADA